MNVRYDVLWFAMMDEIMGRIDELNTKEETDLEDDHEAFILASMLDKMRSAHRKEASRGV